MTLEPALRFSDPFVSIVQLKPIGKIKSITKNPKLIAFFETNSFPSFSQKQVEQIKVLLHKDMSKAEVLTIVHFYFPFRPNQLVDIYQTNESSYSIKELELISNIVLFQFLSWIAYCERVQTFEYFPVILESLLFARKSSNMNLINETFIYSIGVYLSFDEFPDLQLVMGSICNFFVSTLNISDEFFSIFPLFLRKLGQIKQTPFGFFQHLIFIICHYKHDFPKNCVNEILFELTPFLQDLYLSGIAILGYLLDVGDDEPIISVLNILSDSFASKVMQCDVILNLPPNHPKLFKIQDNDFKFDPILKIINRSSITIEINEIIGMKKKSSLNINDLSIFPLKEQISAICDVLGEHPKNIMYFLEKLFFILQNSLDSPKYINLYSVVLYISSKLETFTQPTKSHVFFSPIVFNPFVVPFEEHKNFSLNKGEICLSINPVEIEKKSFLILETLRETAFLLIIKEGKESLCDIFEISLSCPSLFFNLITFSLQNYEYFLNSISMRLIKIFSKAILYFQAKNIDQSMLLSLISMLLTQANCSSMFFTHDYFLLVYLSLIYDNNYRSVIFHELFTKFPKTSKLSASLASIIESIDTNEEKGVLLLHEIICFVIKFSKDFTSLSLVVPSILKRSSHCIFEFIDLLLSISSFYKIDEYESIILASECIKSQQNNYQLFTNLMQLLAGQNSPLFSIENSGDWDLNYIFIIENENILLTILRVYENSAHFNGLVHFLLVCVIYLKKIQLNVTKRKLIYIYYKKFLKFQNQTVY
ncbi:hypothetical protein TRFO_36099 [Tritrichomonas foetus]|uniref:Uncharacterized protein n=1 Tax=Tritrichomonas foetus TaxID=1144522 RepID=A0A1J4JJC2_9EUKA|nr:hypothetical protein TRFO_36099 [Tritrichomonas foetus]|eukprot:OHS97669.1 hypothetical protein TRFO_36099 [Tritrichomonas foetus]